jgi:PBSX family phage terminase large subunit
MSMFKFTEKQKYALNTISSDAGYIMLYGGRRSGKSFINLYTIIMRALKAPGSLHAVFRHKRVDLYKNLIQQTWWKVLETRFPELWEWFQVPLTTHFDKSNLIATFPNKSRIYFSGLDDKKNAQKILGAEYATVFLNEASEESYGMFVDIDSCLAQRTCLRNKFLMDLNPVKTQGRPHWTKEVFINKRDPLEGGTFDDPQNYAYLLMNPHDNLENLDPAYIKRLERMPKEKRDRYLYGLFVEDNSGGVYSDELNLCERDGRMTGMLDVNANYPVHAVFDIGEFTAGWVIQYGEGFVLIHDYIEGKSKPIRWYINEIRQKGYVIDTLFLPDDSKDFKAELGSSVLLVARQEAQNSEVPRKLRFSVMPLKRQTQVSSGINGVRSMFDNLWFNRIKCKKGIEHLKNYRYADMIDPNGSFIDKIKPNQDCNHAADALRYVAVAARFTQAKNPDGLKYRVPGKLYAYDLFRQAIEDQDTTYPGGIR